MYDTETLQVYRKMVVERHLIWERRQAGEPGPWTTDPILSNLKMTNMFRMLDPGSQFVFDLDTDDPVDVIARLILYRITNLPETWYAMSQALGGFPNAEDMTEDLTKILREYRGVGNQIFSGAYIIMPEPGLRGGDKLVGVVKLVRRFLDGPLLSVFLGATTEDTRYQALRGTAGLGDFLSMQVLADWQYLQEDLPDLSFVVAGPGAKRGARLLHPSLSAEDVIRKLTMEWTSNPVVHVNGRSLTPMDVQNTLCEFSKYAREIKNPRKKTPYKPAHPGQQPKPLTPHWW